VLHVTYWLLLNFLSQLLVIKRAALHHARMRMRLLDQPTPHKLLQMRMIRHIDRLTSELNIYRVAQKVSHYQESSLNRIKPNRQCGYISHQF